MTSRTMMTDLSSLVSDAPLNEDKIYYLINLHPKRIMINVYSTYKYSICHIHFVLSKE
jgi:hypothetical protein